MTDSIAGQEDDLKPFITEIREGDAILHAHEVCPHIFVLIEEAGILGYVNASAWKRQIQSCNLCTADLIALTQKGIDALDLPGPMTFLIQQLFDKAKVGALLKQDPPR